ncbi:MULTISPECIES: DUF4145 domain-containing protein [unclassified Inquilinus]|uniref:DUF4145 domain-containing protein n=1 Tax=unclassified Inquilinus TaxID=2645927 RepID=UPI003F8E6FE6
MATLVANCPRCGANSHTLDVEAATYKKTQSDWQHWHELYAVCRNCRKGTIYVVSLKHPDDTNYTSSHKLLELQAINQVFEVEGVISIKDRVRFAPPDHVTPDIGKAFTEGATCLAVECWNAAAAMFRVCLDNATRDLLPTEDPPGMNRKARYDLGWRLPWLFDNGMLPADLRGLASCVHQDGNDGAHRGNLTKQDAEDLLDFTVALLTRLYTEPSRVKLMEERRAARRTPKA